MAKIKRVLELPDDLVQRVNTVGIELHRAEKVLQALQDAGIDTTNEISLNALDKAAREVAEADKANGEVWFEILSLAKQCGYNPADGDSGFATDSNSVICGSVWWYHDDGVAEG